MKLSATSLMNASAVAADEVYAATASVPILVELFDAAWNGFLESQSRLSEAVQPRRKARTELPKRMGACNTCVGAGKAKWESSYIL